MESDQSMCSIEYMQVIAACQPIEGNGKERGMGKARCIPDNFIVRLLGIAIS